MAETFKFGANNWATKKGSVLAYNDQNNNFKPLPFTFTRDSGATYVDSDGLIKVASNGWPRIDYTDNPDGHLLLEPSRKNEMAYSSDIDSWSKTNAPTITTNIFTAPDGTLTADGIQNEDDLNTKYISYAVGGNVSANSTYTASLYIKKETSETGYGGIGLTYTGGTLRYARAAINAVNGTANTLIGSTITPTIKMIDFDSNWWKIEMTATDNGSNTALTFFYLPHISSDFTTSNTTGVSSVRTIWGAQLEQGSYATSYIPTSGTTVTRAAETCAGAGNAQVFNDSEGTVFVHFAADFNIHNSGLSDRGISISNGNDNNSVRIFQAKTLNNGIAYDLDCTAGENQVFNTSTTFSDITDFNKIAFTYKTNEFKIFANGTQKGSTDTSGSTFTEGTLSRFSFNYGANTNHFYGKIKQIGVYDTALTDEELETLTT
jgi:hypothetical protein